MFLWHVCILGCAINKNKNTEIQNIEEDEENHEFEKKINKTLNPSQTDLLNEQQNFFLFV